MKLNKNMKQLKWLSQNLEAKCLYLYTDLALVKCPATLKVEMAIVKDDEESQKNSENFLKLCESNWSAKISDPLIKRQRLQRFNNRY